MVTVIATEDGSCEAQETVSIHNALEQVRHCFVALASNYNDHEILESVVAVKINETCLSCRSSDRENCSLKLPRSAVNVLNAAYE